MLVFLEEYFSLWSNKTLAINYLIKFNQDLTKCKQKTINLHTISAPVNGDTNSQYSLMFKKKARD